MITLLQRCEVVAAKVKQLKLAKRHANQQRLVQERAREWQSRNEKLKSIQTRANCLALAAEAQSSVEEKREQFRHNAAQVLERLVSNEDITKLTDDAAWTRLLAAIEGLTQELESSGKSAWRCYIDDQGSLEAPDWLRDRAPITPANDAAIMAYRTHYAAYASLVKLVMPRSADDLVQLSNIIAACRAEASKITFDVPPDVQLFFRAIQSGTATLASLTPVVLQWLKEHSHLERYRIRSASQ